MEDEEEGLKRRLDHDLNLHPDDNVQILLKAILNRGIEKWKGSKSQGGGEEGFSWGNWAAVVVDVGQHRRDEPDVTWTDADDLDELLRKARTVKEAKKRLQ